MDTLRNILSILFAAPLIIGIITVWRATGGFRRCDTSTMPSKWWIVAFVMSQAAGLGEVAFKAAEEGWRAFAFGFFLITLTLIALRDFRAYRQAHLSGAAPFVPRESRVIKFRIFAVALGVVAVLQLTIGVLGLLLTALEAAA